MKLIEILNKCLDILGVEADSREDGNTSALLNKIRRDVATLQPHYHNLIPVTVENSPDQFTAASYEKTGAQDVNLKPYPQTGENADAPFVSKSDVKTDELNADNSEERVAGSSKPGKVAKANT